MSESGISIDSYLQKHTKIDVDVIWNDPLANQITLDYRALYLENFVPQLTNILNELGLSSQVVLIPTGSIMTLMGDDSDIDLSYVYLGEEGKEQGEQLNQLIKSVNEIPIKPKVYLTHPPQPNSISLNLDSQIEIINSGRYFDSTNIDLDTISTLGSVLDLLVSHQSYVVAPKDIYKRVIEKIKLEIPVKVLEESIRNYLSFRMGKIFYYSSERYERLRSRLKESARKEKIDDSEIKEYIDTRIKCIKTANLDELLQVRKNGE